MSIIRVTVLSVFSLVALFAQPGIRGFPEEQARRQRQLEEKAKAVPNPTRIGEYIRAMSAEPHHAGSAASKKVAEYAAGLFRDWGYDVRIEEFDALLPYPTKRVLEMVAPVEYTAKLKEPPVPEDPDSTDANQLPTYNAYSATGDVTAPLVYVNYGLPEDYEQLREMGIDVKGKIVIARYGKSWRGTKPKVAHENGAVGCLIYSDPRDDGYFQGDVYPKGAFRPPSGVQRGSVMDMPVHVGDPLSPGWPSEKGSRRLERQESVTLMKIPVLPISYEDAQPLLGNLEGPVAPEPWRGALPITYHVGPGPSKVRLALDFDWTTKPLFNVIAMMRGSVHPDQWIVYGNHHDAWVNGADDPASGAAALLETARTLSEQRKQGWQPARTIKFALWDAEEFGLVGSTEWAEKHKEDLSRNAIAYFNSDTNGKGTLGVGATPVLQVFLGQVLRDIQDPVSGDSLLSKVLARREKEKQPPGFRVGPLGAGSDYVAFVHHLGISSANMSFSGDDPGGIYHSVYDSYHWYTKFSDSDFVYGKTLANVMAYSLMRLSEAALLPFEFGSVVAALRDQLTEIGKLKDAEKVDLKQVVTAVEALEKASSRYEKKVSEGEWASASREKLARVNQVLYRSERALLSENGLPGREWYRYQLSAPGLYTGYGAKTLPGVREAIELERWDEGNREANALAAALLAFTREIEKAADLLAAL